MKLLSLTRTQSVSLLPTTGRNCRHASEASRRRAGDVLKDRGHSLPMRFTTRQAPYLDVCMARRLQHVLSVHTKSWTGSDPRGRMSVTAGSGHARFGAIDDRCALVTGHSPDTEGPASPERLLPRWATGRTRPYSDIQACKWAASKPSFNSAWLLMARARCCSLRLRRRRQDRQSTPPSPAANWLRRSGRTSLMHSGVLLQRHPR